MFIDLKIDAERCDFQQCESNECGKCKNIKARLECMTMAFDILGIGERDIEEAKVYQDKSRM